MPISLRSTTGSGGVTIGQVVRLSDSLPIDYVDGNGHRYLRGGNIETNTGLFDNIIWADSVGTLWRETYRSSAPSSNDISAAFFENNTFFIAFNNSASGLKSTDGINWTSASFPSGTIRAIAYGAGLYVCVNQNGSIHTSPDLVTWTPRTISPVVNSRCLVFRNNLFLLGSANGNLWTSADGINWTPRTSTFTSTQDVNAIEYGFGVYVAVGGDGNTNNKIATSSDGVTWTNRVIATGVGATRIESLAFNGSIFVGVIPNIPQTALFQLVYSTDGITWSWTSADDFNNSKQDYEQSTTYGWGSSQIFAIGGKFYSGRMRSSDGLTWEYISTGKTLGFYAGNGSKIICAGKRIDRYQQNVGNLLPSRSISLSVLSAGISESIPEGGTDQYVRIS